MSPRKFGIHVTVQRLSVRPSAPQAYQCLISHFLASLGACNLILYIHVAINWQLSKQCIRWPVSSGRITGSVIDPLSLSVFLKLFTDKLLVFKWSQTQVKFFKCIRNRKLCLWAALLKFWFQADLGRQNSASFYIQGSCFWPWSRVGHALRQIFMLWWVKIWQVSLCGKFMRHLETCVLIAKLTEFCIIMWCFKLSFSSGCTIYKIQLLSRYLCYSWLVC